MEKIIVFLTILSVLSLSVLLFVAKNQIVTINNLTKKNEKIHIKNHELLLDNVKVHTYFENHSCEKFQTMPDVTIECNFKEP